MIKKVYVNMLCVMISLSFFACSQAPKSASHLTSHDIDEALVGNDRDKHGCIGSAGYTWSKLLGECVRVFEKGVALQNALDSDASSAAFVIFALESHEQVELFLPHKPGSILLKRHLEKNSESSSIVWSDSAYTLTALDSPKAPHKAKSYTLTHKGKVIYRK